MFDFGLGEIVVLALIALIVVGPDQIPSVARLFGNWIRQARTVWSRLNEDFGDVFELEHEPEEHEHANDQPTQNREPPGPPALR